MFQNQNLEIIAEDRHESPPHYMPVAMQATFLGQAEYFRENPAIAALSEQLEVEYAAGAVVDVIWTCVVARKPL